MERVGYKWRRRKTTNVLVTESKEKKVKAIGKVEIDVFVN